MAGLVGGAILWLYTLYLGEWRAWPDLIEVDAANRIWRRTSWYPERTGWTLAFMGACLLFLLFILL